MRKCLCLFGVYQIAYLFNLGKIKKNRYKRNNGTRDRGLNCYLQIIFPLTCPPIGCLHSSLIFLFFQLTSINPSIPPDLNAEATGKNGTTANGNKHAASQRDAHSQHKHKCRSRTRRSVAKVPFTDATFSASFYLCPPLAQTRFAFRLITCTLICNFWNY